MSIGSATATTGPDGRFELSSLTAGPATLRCTAAGFEDFAADITVTSGSMALDVTLSTCDRAPLTVVQTGDQGLVNPLLELAAPGSPPGRCG